MIAAPPSVLAPAAIGSADPVAAIVALLADAAVRHAPLVQVTSLGPEDMLITDVIARHRLPIEVVTLDTGRLPRETYALLAQAQRLYGPQGTAIRVIWPEPAAVEIFVHRYGIDGFYDSVEARKACCDARKVRPLARALAGKHGWVTGLRRGQSSERAFCFGRRFLGRLTRGFNCCGHLFGGVDDGLGRRGRGRRLRRRSRNHRLAKQTSTALQPG